MAINRNYKHSEITDKIIKCFYNIHNYLENGFQEVVYQRCMKIEFKKTGLLFEREIDKPIYYHNDLVCLKRIDFLVEDVILLELKAVKEMNDAYYAQILKYLKTFKLQVGLLINFCKSKLKIKRFIQTNF